jgi:hypothetical protein
MSRKTWQALLTTVLTLLLLIVGALGTATAAPKMNQIVIEDATCKTDDVQSSTHTFVINGMAKTGHLTDSNGNIVVTSYTVTYSDDKGNLLGTDKYSAGTKLNSRDDILSCRGQVDTTLQGRGKVTAVYVFKGFLTTPTG